MEKEEVLSKWKRLEKARPLDVDLVKNLEDWFRVELTYTSNAIEGNTLTRQETAVVVEKGMTIGRKTLVEHLEAVNHAAALDWVNEVVVKGGYKIGERDVLKLHEMILKGIDDRNAGRYRSVAVRIAGSRVVLPNPMKVSLLMEEFSKWLGASRAKDPVEMAIEAHYRLVTIHPFVDGNGRTARLLMNMILMSYGYPPALIRKRDRLRYIKSLEKAQLGGSRDDFDKVIYEAISRSLDIYLEALEGGGVALDGGGMTLLKIGEVARETGQTRESIRHWTEMGLIEVAQVTESGYRLYDEGVLKRIEKIVELKARRYTLREIRDELK